MQQTATRQGHTVKSRPCSTCEGTGLYRRAAYGCGAAKAPATTAPFPCPDCRPADYAIAAGVELRNQGKYVEAIVAATKVMDNWSIGDTMVAWGVSPKEAQAALRVAVHMRQTDLARLRHLAATVRPKARKLPWHTYAQLIPNDPAMAAILAETNKILARQTKKRRTTAAHS